MRNRAIQTILTLLILGAALIFGGVTRMGPNGWLIWLFLGGGLLITCVMLGFFLSPVSSVVTEPFRGKQSGKNDA